jgi:arylsulfatase
VNGLPLVQYKDRNVYPITGLSLLGSLEGTAVGTLHTEAVGEEQYGRAYLRYGPWKALWVEPPYGPADGHWQLYNIVLDRAETTDLSKVYPNVVKDLYARWKNYQHDTGAVGPLRPIGYY